MNGASKPKRAILYYPTIAIPTGDWLRQALMYWDEIGSIVPEQWELSHKYSDDISYLKDVGQFRAFRPEQLTQAPASYEARKRLASEFRTILKSPHFQKMHGLAKNRRHELEYLSIAPKAWNVWHIYDAKVWHEITSDLSSLGMIDDDPRRHPGEHIVEKNAALLYMSLLAKYVADIDAQATVLGTDDRAYEKLIYDADSQQDGIVCIDVRYFSALPIPRKDVSIAAIVAFKQRRRNELLSFRERVAELERQVSQAESPAHVKDILTTFSNSIEKELNNLGALLKDSKIEAGIGCFKTIINIKSPAFLGTLGTAALAGVFAAHPVAWTLGGLGVSGGIEVAQHLISKRNAKRATLREESVAFLYHAQREGLVDFH